MNENPYLPVSRENYSLVKIVNQPSDTKDKKKKGFGNYIKQKVINNPKTTAGVAGLTALLGYLTYDSLK